MDLSADELIQHTCDCWDKNDICHFETHYKGDGTPVFVDLICWICNNVYDTLTADNFAGMVVEYHQKVREKYGK